MVQMNIEELKVGIGLAKDVIEGKLMDMYITKKLLMGEGFSAEDLDGFIAGKVREYDRKYSEMDDEEFVELLPHAEEQEGDETIAAEAPDYAETPDAELLQPTDEATDAHPGFDLAAEIAMLWDDETPGQDDPEAPDLDSIEANPLEMLQNFLNAIDGQVEEVMFVKRAMIFAGVDPDEMAMAISDTAREYDERYMKMTQAEIEETIFRRLMEMTEEAVTGRSNHEETDFNMSGNFADAGADTDRVGEDAGVISAL